MDDFSKIQCFCLFIGAPRSGCSILGGLLDAHPRIVIAHEFDAIRHSEKLGRDKLFFKLIKNARDNAPKGRKAHCDYSSKVPRLFQGKFKSLEVIGDKKADYTALHLLRKPERLEKFQQLVQTEVKFIHVVRNPFDNISTILLRKGKAKNYSLTSGSATSNWYGSMENGVIGFYFDKIIASTLKLQERAPEHFVTIYHEDLVANPTAVLRKMCQFLGQHPGKEYLEGCAKIVYKKPHKTRTKVKWKNREIENVKRRMEAVPFLQRYLKLQF